MFENKTVWRNYSDEQIDDLVERVFSYYRSNGFPFFPTDDMYRISQLSSLGKYKDNVYLDGTVKQTMHGLGFLWSFHPESFSVKSNGKLSPMEAFLDDAIFEKVIRKRIKIGDNLTPNGIRKMLKMYSGVQGVSNFRPTAARDIYRKFLPNGGVTWDMSSGWGGRLLGAHVAGGVSYIGTDPSIVAQENNREIAKYIGYDCELYTVGSECFSLDKNSVDLCFTSPPYFDCERYSSDEGQSFIRYPEKHDWIEGYLMKTLLNCHYSLKINGLLVVNIANVPSYKSLENDFLASCKRAGFSLVGIDNLALSSSIGKTGFKYEPIFIFKKDRLL